MKTTVKLWLKRHQAGELSMKFGLKRFFVSLGKQLKLHQAAEASDKAAAIEELFQVKEVKKKLVRAATPYIIKLVANGAQAEFKLIQGHRKRKLPLKINLPKEARKGVEQHIDEIVAAPSWGTICDTVRKDLLEVVASGVDTGLSNDEIADALEGVLGPAYSEVRALRIARTEATGTLNGGAQAVRSVLAKDKLIKGKMWYAISDQDTRETHDEAHEQEVGPDDVFEVGAGTGRYPGDGTLPVEERVNCILPGAEIVGRYEAGARSLYSGQVLEIVMASGRRLTLTPKHRVLAENGLVAACTLNEGQQVFSYDSQVDSAVMDGVAKDEDYKPAKIEEVFEALRLLGATEIKRPHEKDFNGDGNALNGQIDIVRANVCLRFGGYTSRFKERSHLHFGREYLSASEKHGEGPLRLFRRRMLPALASPPRRFALTANRRRISSPPFPLLNLGGGSIADRNLVGEQHPFDGGATHAQLISDGLGRVASSVLLDDLPGIDITTKILCAGDAAAPQTLIDRRDGATEMLGQLLDTMPGEVFLDKIVLIRSAEFNGHVFDLQSPTHLIVANGIVISNCRCTCLTIFNDEDLDDGDG